MEQSKELYAQRVRSLAPAEEPERQYYFIDVMRSVIAEEEARKGRKLTMHVETFGCQMNAKDSETLS